VRGGLRAWGLQAAAANVQSAGSTNNVTCPIFGHRSDVLSLSGARGRARGAQTLVAVTCTLSGL